MNKKSLVVDYDSISTLPVNEAVSVVLSNLNSSKTRKLLVYRNDPTNTDLILILRALGFSEMKVKSKLKDLGNILKDVSDNVLIISNDLSVTPLLSNRDCLLYSVFNKKMYDHESLKSISGFEPFYSPLVLSLYGNDSYDEKSLTTLPFDTTTKIINSYDGADIGGLISIISEHANISDALEFDKRLNSYYGADYSFESKVVLNKSNNDTFYKLLLRNKMPYWIPDKNRRSDKIPISLGEGVFSYDGDKNYETLIELIKETKSLFFYLDDYCLSNNKIAISCSESKVYIFDLNSEKLKSIINECNGKYSIAVSNLRKLKSHFELSNEFISNIVCDFEIATYARDSYSSHLNIYEKFSDICLINKSEISDIKDTSKDTQIKYIASVADACFRSTRACYSYLSQNNLLDYHLEFDIPANSIFSDMEKNGAYIDKKTLTEYYPYISEKCEKLALKINKYSKEAINLNSPSQLGDFLFKRLGIKSEVSSLTFDNIVSLKDKHPVVPLIVQYKQFNSVRDAANKILKFVKDDSDFISCTIKSTHTVTGRLSTESPNLQGIKSNSSDSAFIKKSFKSRFGSNGLILAADYSQVELRILAHLSGDKALINAFCNNVDIHAATAASVLSKPISEVSKSERKNAKAINFGLIYGKTPYGLAKELEISEKDAQKYISAYFSRYPMVAQCLNRFKADAMGTGSVRTITGRKVRIPLAQSPDKKEREKGLRQSMNAPMQGTAADIIKMAMVNISKKIQERKLKSVLFLQVHDELVFDVHSSELDVIKDLVKTEMESAVNLRVPLTVDIELGDSWGSELVQTQFNKSDQHKLSSVSQSK